MRRPRYEESGMDRQRWEREVLRPDWGTPHPSDPNWRDGHYHGMRSAGGPWQASYGLHRVSRREDLGGSGGLEGRYSRPMGGFGRDGLLGYEDRRSVPREPRRRDERPPLDYDESWQGGGVRGDAGYLRQYNSRSPELRYGHDYQRSPGPGGGRTA